MHWYEGQSVMTAAPVGDNLTGSALMLLDSQGQPHCLRPSRPTLANQVLLPCQCCLSSDRLQTCCRLWYLFIKYVITLGQAFHQCVCLGEKG